MPRVPTLQTGTVTTRQLPQVRVTPDAPQGAFGGGPALAGSVDAAVQLNNAAIQIVQQEKERADKLATTQYLNEINQIVNEEQIIYQKKQGVSVLDGDFLGEYDTRIKDRVKEAKERLLKNREQSDIATSIDSRVISPARISAQNYFWGETKKAESEQRNSAKKLTKEKAAMNWNNAEILNQAKIETIAISNEDSLSKGLSPEGATFSLLSDLSDFHSGVMNSMIGNDNYRAAEFYFDTNEKEMLADHKKTLQRIIDEGKTDQLALSLARKIVDENPNDLKAQQREMDKIKDPDLFDRTNRHRKNRIKENEDISAQLHEQDFTEAYKQASERGSFYRIDPALRAVITDPKEIAIIERGIQGIPEVTDWGMYTTRMDELDENSEQALKIPAIAMRPYFADPEYKKYLEARKGKKDGGSTDVLNTFRTEADILKETLKEYDQEALLKDNTFRRKLADEQIKEQKRLKRPLEEHEFQELVDKMMVPIETKGKTFLGKRIRGTSKEFLFQLEPGEKFNILDVGRVPRLERKKIIEKIDLWNRKNPNQRIEITNENIRLIYGKSLGKKEK